MTRPCRSRILAREELRVAVPTILSEKRTMRSANGPYPADSLIPERVSGTEMLCGLATYEVDFITDETAMAPADMLGKTVGLSLGPEDGTAPRIGTPGRSPT